jgi:hypothetical protein
MELGGPMPEDSPRFPTGALITETLLNAYPNAEAGMWWRQVCQYLVGDASREPTYARVSEFLKRTPDDVSGLAREWLEVRGMEIAETGRQGAQQGELIPLTRGNIETLLLHIHECASTLVGQDNDQDVRRRAELSLTHCVNRFPRVGTARLVSGPPGLREASTLMAALVSDFGMAFFLKELLLPAVWGVCERKLIRCVHCGKIEKPVRRPQRRCKECAHKPGVRQKDARERKRAQEA